MSRILAQQNRNQQGRITDARRRTGSVIVLPKGGPGAAYNDDFAVKLISATHVSVNAGYRRVIGSAREAVVAQASVAMADGDGLWFKYVYDTATWSQVVQAADVTDDATQRAVCIAERDGNTIIQRHYGSVEILSLFTCDSLEGT